MIPDDKLQIFTFPCPCGKFQHVTVDCKGAVPKIVKNQRGCPHADPEPELAHHTDGWRVKVTFEKEYEVPFTP